MVRTEIGGTGMARLSEIGSIVIGEDSVPLKIVVQGYASTWHGIFEDAGDTPINLTGATVSCKVEFGTFKLIVNRTGPTAAAGSFVVDTTKDEVDLVVEKDPDQGANPGKFTVAIPANIYTDDIPPDITSDVPVAIGYLKYAKGTETRVARFLMAFRRGDSA